MGSGWPWPAAQPSGWDQTTSITPQLWAWPDRAHTQDTQREACGILWGFPFPAPAREGVQGEGCGSAPSRSCFQAEGRGWGPLHGGGHVLTHVGGTLSDSHICDLGLTGELRGHLSEDPLGLPGLEGNPPTNPQHRHPEPWGQSAAELIHLPRLLQCPHDGLPTLDWTPGHAQLHLPRARGHNTAAGYSSTLHLWP